MFQAAGLQFRGEKIWRAAMDDLKAKGMRNAKQVFYLCPSLANSLFYTLMKQFFKFV